MIIDGTQQEETRVAVVKDNRLEEFDYETVSKLQLKGNVYLAKITRVEPSLQAAFVEYGGGRNGFLAFSEIHPDYYQIPVADRKAILDAQLAEQALVYEKDFLSSENIQSNSKQSIDLSSSDKTEDETKQFNLREEEEEEDNTIEINNDETNIEDNEEEALNQDDGLDDTDELEELKKKSSELLKSYKIQEVIKKGQIILVQVTKEERGNKGAALTSYISLAGRYCVLMPNTARGGGISRKISNNDDRKKIREIVDSLNVPDGMALIIRTAGAERTKTELKRDYEYLFQLWEEIRKNTLVSRAPTLVHEEGNLIKRSLRDIYTKDTDEVLIQGIEAYKAAKQYMKMLLPSHAKKVQQFKIDTPIFNHFKVDAQLDTMLERRVELKSGGHLVIDSTEALVAIDVNSGRSTRERNIEETAIKTNIEAAEETARQLKLRDLAGLIVIDFIDMHEYRNNRSVERKLKESLRFDRARIQVGRISSFGLLEMSRQRLRTSLIEASTEICVKCKGTGLVRSVDSSSIKVLRAIEEEAYKGKNYLIKVNTPNQVGIYLLNHKRQSIQNIESTYNVEVNINLKNEINPPDFDIERKALNNSNAQGEESKNDSSLDENSKSANKRRRRGKRGGKKRKNDDEDLKTNKATDDVDKKVKNKDNLDQVNEGKEVNIEKNIKKTKPTSKNKALPKKRGKRPQKKFKDTKTDDELDKKNEKVPEKENSKKTEEIIKKPIKASKNGTDKNLKKIKKENIEENKDSKNKKVGWWNKK